MCKTDVYHAGVRQSQRCTTKLCAKNVYDKLFKGGYSNCFKNTDGKNHYTFMNGGSKQFIQCDMRVGYFWF